LPENVSDARWLDLHDIGTLVGEHLPAERAGNDLAELQHPDAVQWATGLLGRGGLLRRDGGVRGHADSAGVAVIVMQLSWTSQILIAVIEHSFR